MEKLKGGAKFDEVAKEFSEDKARAGKCCPCGIWGLRVLFLTANVRIQVVH